MPTGGVEPTEESLREWFGAGIVACGIGSNLITKELLDAKDYAGIEARVRDTVALIKTIRGQIDGRRFSKIRSAAERRKWDCASFGEVMLRFDPGFGRVRNARQFQVWEGGGEYNVARAMRKCWGKRAARRHRAAGQRSRLAGRRLHDAGRRRHARRSSGASSTASAATRASASTSPRRASASAPRSAARIAATPPRRRSSPAK